MIKQWILTCSIVLISPSIFYLYKKRKKNEIKDQRKVISDYKISPLIASLMLNKRIWNFFHAI